jgi:hypothetical protein
MDETDNNQTDLSKMFNNSNLSEEKHETPKQHLNHKANWNVSLFGVK